MKKIISLVCMIVFLGTNFSWALTCPNTTDIVIDFGGTQQCCDTSCQSARNSLGSHNCDPQIQGERNPTASSCCPKGQVYDTDIKSCTLPQVTVTGDKAGSSTSVMGISCSPDQLVNGQCKLSIYETLGIRKSVINPGEKTSVGLFVQDIVLSATFFIGTLVTIALIVSGLMFIFAASSGKDPANAKKGIMGSLVGLLIVVSSYVIIRLVQYIAKGF